jgi:hypothetical protein
MVPALWWMGVPTIPAEKARTRTVKIRKAMMSGSREGMANYIEREGLDLEAIVAIRRARVYEVEGGPEEGLDEEL